MKYKGHAYKLKEKTKDADSCIIGYMEYVSRKMTADNAEEIMVLYRSNPQYFLYCPPEADLNSVKNDLTICPSGCTSEQKHCIGYYAEGKLTAFLDLITDYPKHGQAYIGLFMVHGDMHHKGIGSKIINKLCEDLKERGYTSVSLGYVKTNIPAEKFWKNNGFIPTRKEIETELYTICSAERKLQ